MEKEVSKTYEKMERIGAPYKEDGKAYIKVKYPCCNNVKCKKCNGEGFYPKQVRWYGKVDDLEEYRRCLGFGATGYIYIFAGNDEEIQEYFLNQLPRHYGYFSTRFGWYLPNGKEVPDNLPPSIIPIKLFWEDVNTKERLEKYPQMLRKEKLCSQKK